MRAYLVRAWNLYKNHNKVGGLTDEHHQGVVPLVLLLAACGQPMEAPSAADPVAAPAPAPAVQASSSFAQVNEARLRNADAEPGQWMSHGRNYDEQHYTPLQQINTGNVAQQGLAWFGDFDTNRGQEAMPLVIDGMIYVSTAWSKVYAFDARIGAQLWMHDPEVPGRRV
jgi:quinohemoprotein ethanol dehydrogenase